MLKGSEPTCEYLKQLVDISGKKSELYMVGRETTTHISKNSENVRDSKGRPKSAERMRKRQ